MARKKETRTTEAWEHPAPPSEEDVAGVDQDDPDEDTSVEDEASAADEEDDGTEHEYEVLEDGTSIEGVVYSPNSESEEGRKMRITLTNTLAREYMLSGVRLKKVEGDEPF